MRVFSFLVFSIYKNLKPNHHLLFLANFHDLEMIKFWSVNFVCQVSKSYFCFSHFQNFGQYLYLSVFSKQWSVLLCPTKCSAFVKLRCSHCTQNYSFCTFWKLKTLVLWQKIVQNLLILADLFCPKQQ